MGNKPSTGPNSPGDHGSPRNGRQRNRKSESNEHPQVSTSSNTNNRPSNSGAPDVQSNSPHNLRRTASSSGAHGMGEPVSPNTLAQHFSQLFGSPTSSSSARQRNSNSSSSQNNNFAASTDDQSQNPQPDISQLLNAMFARAGGGGEQASSSNPNPENSSSSNMRSFMQALASPASSSRPRVFERNGAYFAFINGRIVQLQAQKTCQYCNKQINPFQEEYDLHVVKCMTKPRIKSVTFEISEKDTDLLEDDLECTICFDEYKLGQMCARLECFCVFHKPCLDSWLSRKQCCPLHMKDDD